MLAINSHFWSTKRTAFTLRDFISVFELSSSADWFNNSGARVVIATVIPLNANMIQWTEPEQ